jgi:hypothetical protein
MQFGNKETAAKKILGTLGDWSNHHKTNRLTKTKIYICIKISGFIHFGDPRSIPACSRP